MLELDVSTVNKILNRKPGTKFRTETIDRVHDIARKHGFNFGRLKFAHRRQHERREINRAAHISIDLSDGTVFDQGPSKVRDISLGGARLTDLGLPKGVLPARPFKVTIQIDGAQIQGVPVRLILNGKMDIAVMFNDIDEARQKLRKFL